MGEGYQLGGAEASLSWFIALSLVWVCADPLSAASLGWPRGSATPLRVWLWFPHAQPRANAGTRAGSAQGLKTSAVEAAILFALARSMDPILTVCSRLWIPAPFPLGAGEKILDWWLYATSQGFFLGIYKGQHIKMHSICIYRGNTLKCIHVGHFLYIQGATH